MFCPNCGKELGCSCELIRGLDGKQCCSHCVMEHNKNYKKEYLEKTYKKIINSNRRYIV